MLSIHDGNIKYLFASARHTDVVCPRHLHISMEVILVTEGVLHVTIGSREYRVPRGSAVFVPPLEPHLFHSEMHNKCHVIMFMGELVPYFNEFAKSNTASTLLFSPSEESFSLAEKLLPHDTNNIDSIHANAVLAPLCCDIVSVCNFIPFKTPMNDAMAEALEYIHTHFTENITLQTVARAVGIHPVTLSRNFTGRVKTNFNAYLNYLRASHAAMLLKSSKMTVADIAYSAGFGSIRSFNRAFSSIYRVTPSEYRIAPFI